MTHASHIRAEGPKEEVALKQCGGEATSSGGSQGEGLVGLQLSATLAKAVPP